MSNQHHRPLSDDEIRRRAIGFATTTYHAFKLPGGPDAEASTFRQDLRALKDDLGVYNVPVFRHAEPGDEVTAAIQGAAQLAADQVAHQWSQLVGNLAAVFAHFAIDAENKAPTTIDVSGFLQSVALNAALLEHDDEEGGSSGQP